MSDSDSDTPGEHLVTHIMMQPPRRSPTRCLAQVNQILKTIDSSIDVKIYHRSSSSGSRSFMSLSSDNTFHEAFNRL
jgi:hypothetical protein